MRQTFPRVFQADSVSRLAMLRGPRPAVANFQAEQVAFTPRAGLDYPVIDAVCDSVPDGILYDRLQQKTRHQAIQGARIDPHLDAEAIGKPYLFDCKIVLHDLQFLGERHFLRCSSLQRALEDSVK